MSEQHRRDVLKGAGLTVTGGLLATGVAAADDGADGDGETTALEEADGWSSLGGDPGNNAVVPTARGPEPPVAVAWEYDRSGPIAVVDETVYLTTEGEVHALDAAAGSLEWKTDAIGASGTPTVTSEVVYVGGDRLVGLDPATGEICCRHDLGPDEAVPSPAVADGLALVVAGGVLYAVDADNHEVRWRFEPDGDPLFEQPVAVADGAVFAASESRVFALELEDGSVRWSDDDPTGDDEYDRFTAPNPRQVSYPVAAGDVVAVGSVDSEPAAVWPNGHTTLYDTETGEKLVSSERGLTPGPIADDRFYARTVHGLVGFDRETGAKNWQTEFATYHVSSAVVADGTVYAGVTINGEAYGPGEIPEPQTGVYAVDETGAVKWTLGTEERPTLALVDGTLYASGETLLAIRSESDEETDADEDDEGDDGDDGDDEPEDESDESDGDEDDEDETGGDGENETDDDDEDETGGDDEDDDEANETDTEPESDDEETDSERESDDDGDDEDGTDGNDEDDGNDGDDDATDTESESDDEETAGGNETESEADDPGETEAREADDDESEETEERAESANASETETQADETDEGETIVVEDGTPGFTAGAGIAGGALTLEWLRRAGRDEDP